MGSGSSSPKTKVVPVSKPSATALGQRPSQSRSQLALHAGSFPPFKKAVRTGPYVMMQQKPVQRKLDCHLAIFSHPQSRACSKMQKDQVAVVSPAAAENASTNDADSDADSPSHHRQEISVGVPRPHSKSSTARSWSPFCASPDADSSPAVSDECDQLFNVDDLQPRGAPCVIRPRIRSSSDASLMSNSSTATSVSSSMSSSPSIKNRVRFLQEDGCNQVRTSTVLYSPDASPSDISSSRGGW
eukprot:ANDGO_04484.mRNA.1 hypothetical protein